MLSRFEPAMLDGPWARRMRGRRAWIDELPWDEALPRDPATRWTWTQTAYSEYAAAASFSAISSALAAAGAPIDLIGLTSDFVVDEIVHVEVSARIAAALGGGVQLEVDLERLVRPPSANDRVTPSYPHHAIKRLCLALTYLLLLALRLSRARVKSASH